MRQVLVHVQQVNQGRHENDAAADAQKAHQHTNAKPQQKNDYAYLTVSTTTGRTPLNPFASAFARSSIIARVSASASGVLPAYQPSTTPGAGGTIASVTAGDEIIVQGTSIASVSFDPATHVLTLFDAGNATIGALQLGALVDGATLLAKLPAQLLPLRRSPGSRCKIASRRIA